jgi:hypothetical protein
VSHEEETRNKYKTAAGRREVNRPLGTPRPRQEDNIKIDLKKQGTEV